MQIKVFSGQNIQNVEDEVNEFLKSHKDIKVIDIKQSESMGVQYSESIRWSLTITVMYEDRVSNYPNNQKVQNVYNPGY